MLYLAEYRQRPAMLADWLPWAGLIAPGVVLNKDGSFQRTARFRGPDLDSATQGELIATTARLNNALRRLVSYVNATVDKHMVAYEGDRAGTLEISLYSDADFAGDKETSRSTTGVFPCVRGAHPCDPIHLSLRPI